MSSFPLFPFKNAIMHEDMESEKDLFLNFLFLLIFMAKQRPLNVTSHMAHDQKPKTQII